MGLVERLGYRSLNELYKNMDNNELMEWAAYDKTQDPKWLKRYFADKKAEDDKHQTLEEEADKIKSMLMGLGKTKEWQ